MKLYEKIGIGVGALLVFLPTIIYFFMGKNQGAAPNRLLMVSLAMLVFSVLALVVYLYFYLVKLKIFAVVGLIGFITGLLRLYYILLPRSLDRNYYLGGHGPQMTHIVMGLVLGAYGQLLYWIGIKVYQQVKKWKDSTRKEAIRGVTSIVVLTGLLAGFIIAGLMGWELMVDKGLFHL